MPSRTWIALLLLINYLLVVGAGCMSRPGDQRGFVMVQTKEGHKFQECRYLRMDGLENFLAEALASRYENAPETPKQHILSVVSGVDAHHLTGICWSLIVPGCHQVATPATNYQSPVSAEVPRAVNAPPWLS